MEKNDVVPELTNGEFEPFIKKGLVLVDFFAEWCMPCVMMGPVVDELATKFKGKIKFGKVNIEDNNILAQKLGVRSIPNFILFKEGKQIENFVGTMPSEDFEERLNEFI
ncbi:MAG: thioredoxin [Parcubacteria group bacterium]|jgi:thioredoxin 1